jgi:uncharacterized membrane protein
MEWVKVHHYPVMNQLVGGTLMVVVAFSSSFDCVCVVALLVVICLAAGSVEGGGPHLK